MSQRRPILADDHAHQFFSSFLNETEDMLRRALQTLDESADCAILPAADVGIPYDAMRLAGGFATGCVVSWNCSVPVIPIDTTMNIDTSSVFWLDSDPTEHFTESAIEALRTRIGTDSSYEWNFNTGNHFILHCITESGQHALVLHSNEKEFKNQYNGLCPTAQNWYEDDVISFAGTRPIRLLVGKRAALFAAIAEMLREYNIIRHKFIAEMLVGASTAFTNELHKHHYFMPNSSTAALGCYICDPLEEVPLFSSFGQDLAIFRPTLGGQNSITLVGGDEKLIVPHGWGTTIDTSVNFHHGGRSITLNSETFRLLPGVSLLGHPEVRGRQFEGGTAEFLRLIGTHTPGHVTSALRQKASYSRHGFHTHAAVPD